jgi:multidrug resistance efflux pump
MNAESPYRSPALLAQDRAVRLVHPRRAAKIVVRIFLVAFTVVVVSLIVVPWQQTSRATGRVIAFAPLERQQTIDAPVDGRVARWHVIEGDHVNAGDPIVDVVDNDPDILSRLREERDAQRSRIEAAKARIAAIESRIEALRSSRESGISAAGSRVQMARDRIRAAEQAAEASEIAYKTAILNEDRQRRLFEEGLSSKRQVELAELEAGRTRTDLDRARAALNAARGEEVALTSDRDKVGNDLNASITDAFASKSSAEAELASANAELARIEVRLARQTTQEVKAPRDGYILRVVAKQGGEMVKMGQTLAVIVPDATDRAIEVWVDGNDVPLIVDGRAVRIQFEGWPAVQFSGWPSVAVGTFGGRVAFVDAADDGSGRFRTVIVPDEEDEEWPDARFLRQGARVNSWILLGRVSLGWELWRKLNGFPPSYPGPTGGFGVESKSSGGKSK